MNILVLDVAASASGALSILQQYYEDFQKDTENKYVLCVSREGFKSTENVTVLEFPWVKRSWLHRLLFEYRYVRELFREYQIDRVFSLENLLLADLPCEKWIYLHTSLPFSDVPISFLRTPKLWVYRHVIGRMICASLRRADRIVVQTRWMKDACAEKSHVALDKIEVQQPRIECLDVVKCTDREAVRSRLFYPATPLVYKNHMLLLEALKRLKERGAADGLYLDLTLTGQENTLARKIYDLAQEHALPVNFLGKLTRAEVMAHYAVSTLVFPSYIESFGLPLLEARLSDTVILASDSSFSREILEGYSDAYFFDPYTPEGLASLIQGLIERTC